MDDILRIIHENETFVLSGHIGPDGDCIGACMGLAFALDILGKNVTVVLEPYPEKYNIIPGQHFLNTYDLNNINVDTFIALDCADANRLGSSKKLFERAKTTICIDHHKTNLGFAQFNLIEANASSTCEIVYCIIEKFVKPTIEIATAIYAGIISDTGGFKYNTTNISTLEITSKLIGMNLPFTKIYNEVLHSHTFTAVRAKGVVMQNAKQSMGGRITYSYVSKEEMESVDAVYSDMEGNVEYLLATSGTDVAAVIFEKKYGNEVKVSFRSCGPDVSNVASKLGGGGHQLAAAGTVNGNLEEVVKRTLQLIEEEIAEYDRRT